MFRKEVAERARVRSSHPERIDRRGRGRRRGRAWTRRSRAAAPPSCGSNLGADRSAPRDRQAVRQGNQTALHGGPGDDAFCAREGPGVSLAPVPGPLSIATGTVIVEVLVGWSLALLRRFRSPPPSQKRPGVRADFLHTKKKKKKKQIASDNLRPLSGTLKITGLKGQTIMYPIIFQKRSGNPSIIKRQPQRKRKIPSYAKSLSPALARCNWKRYDFPIRMSEFIAISRTSARNENSANNNDQTAKESIRNRYVTRSGRRVRFSDCSFFFFLSTNQSKLVLCKQQWCNRYSNVSYHIKKY